MVPPKHLPTSTPTTIVYRFIAEFMTHTFGRLDRWECRNGFNDSYGYGGEREDWFAKFPGRTELGLPNRHPSLCFGTAYYYWFLVKNGEPMLCLTTDGLAYTLAGVVYNLAEDYHSYRQFWRLISSVAGDLLP